MNKVLLGVIKQGAGTYADGEVVYLSKHSWDCGWYWGFGYVGSSRTHFHIRDLIGNSLLASELFSDTRISDDAWWVIRDLFKQAYALKSAAEVYRNGGHQTSRHPEITGVVKNADRAKQLNDDLQKVLDTAWDFVVNTVNQGEKQ